MTLPWWLAVPVMFCAVIGALVVAALVLLVIGAAVVSHHHRRSRRAELHASTPPPRPEDLLGFVIEAPKRLNGRHPQ